MHCIFFPKKSDFGKYKKKTLNIFVPHALHIFFSKK